MELLAKGTSVRVITLASSPKRHSYYGMEGVISGVLPHGITGVPNNAAIYKVRFEDKRQQLFWREEIEVINKE